MIKKLGFRAQCSKMDVKSAFLLLPMYEFRQSFWGPVQWEALSNLKLDDRKTALQFYQHLLHSLPFPTLLKGYSKLILNFLIHKVLIKENLTC
jgi:hypothetical protein